MSAFFPAKVPKNVKRKKINQRANKNIPITLDQLESFLLESADILHGNMDTSGYKDYILGILHAFRGGYASCFLAKTPCRHEYL